MIEEIKKALLSQKNLSLYYLGIAGIGLIKKDIALELLKRREMINQKVIEEIKGIFKKQGGSGLPLEAKALFEHPILLVQADIDFIKKFRKRMVMKNG